MHRTVSPILINKEEEEEKREKRKGKEIKTNCDIDYVKDLTIIEFGDGYGGHEKYNLCHIRGE